MQISDEMIEAGLQRYSEGGCSGLADYERREVVQDILEAAFALVTPTDAAVADLAKMMRERVGSAYDDEATFSSTEVDQIIAVLSPLPTPEASPAPVEQVEFDLCVTGTNINSEYQIALRFKGEQFFEGFNLGRYDTMNRGQIALLHRIRDMYPGVSASLPATTPTPVSPIMDEVRRAAEAVIRQWDTPNWKLREPTGAIIENLRRALAGGAE